jgi:LPXTG-site transpeptidase (sortase) family protein
MARPGASGRRRSPAHRAAPRVPGAQPRVALAIALGLGLLAAVIAVSGATSPVAPPVAAAAPSAAARPDPAPLRAAQVHLPTLDVRSELVDLDVAADGVLQPPVEPDVAGWYVGGAVPGEPGPAVIAGHVDSRAGPAVFFRLDELRPGDAVEVTRSDGQVITYRVVTVERHPKNAFPTARVYGPTPGAELRLITCGGDFDRNSRHYLDNVVVTAVPGS